MDINSAAKATGEGAGTGWRWAKKGKWRKSVIVPTIKKFLKKS